MRLLITGASGNIGQELMCFCQNESIPFIGYDSKGFNLKEEFTIRRKIEEFNPTHVINCAAITNVDWCELNKDEANLVNGYAVEWVAKACKDVGATLIQISTDYVFDGTKSTAYEVGDSPNPIQEYGKSKLIGEEMALKHGGNVARVQWIVGTHKKNYVSWIADSLMKKEQVSLSSIQYGCPTTAKNAADMLLNFSMEKPVGQIFHVSNNGFCNRYECGVFISEKIGTNKKYLKSIKSTNFGLAKRPANTMLSNSSFKLFFDIDCDGWEVDVHGYLRRKYGIK